MTSLTEFLNLASKIIPEYDGSAENLTRFLDALNIIETIKGAHESTAVELIKTKLKGTIRNSITIENTIDSIKGKLKNAVKGESVDTLSAKLLNVKQNNKTANTYAKEIEELTKSLSNAYISDGLNADLANKYATRTAVQAISKNANNEKVKLIVESGTFTNIDEVVSKFVNASNDVPHTSQSQLLYFNKRHYSPQYYRGRGRGYNSYRPNNFRYYNNNNNNRGQNNAPRNNNYRGRFNNNQNRTPNRANVRYANNESGNSNTPVVHQEQQGERY